MSINIQAFQVDSFQSVARLPDGTYIRSNERPLMSFDYDILTFTYELKQRTWNGQAIDLTAEEITEVQTYINNIEVHDELNDAMSVIHNSKKILEGTDWYVIRQSETGKAIPDNIMEMRSKARDLINEAEKSL